MFHTSNLTVRPSSPDLRDYIYEQADIVRPAIVDLREWDSTVEDQYKLGSCVGVAISNAYEHMIKRKYPNQFVELSRLFIYYNARLQFNEQSTDAGATVRNGLKGLKLYGVCKESIWPYIIDKFDDQPSLEAYQDAKSRKIPRYFKLNSNDDVVNALVFGKPVVFGIEVFDSFMELTKENSTVANPIGKDMPAGGHAMCLVGYNLEKNLFLAKNSFGTDWGDNGYCWIPFDYFNNYSYDAWVFDITQIPVLFT